MNIVDRNGIIEIEGWARVRVLGKGGFGLVVLYQNLSSNEKIAIKSLREKELEGIIKPKHKERWQKEVDIMHKLKHKNVVQAMDLPCGTLQLNGTPLLAMEYCSLGDLRQLLVKPENCCGLKESTVRDILRDVSCGISFLHSCKVIHRDLKPDNIMLQDEGGKTVYKLIDLGFAKELEQGSLCESFVGTVQYLAPELFLGKPYTCSVDYWSFGQVAHEIITGHRPFLPGLPPVVWMKEIQNKKKKIISVVQTWSGDTVHSSSLSKVSHLSGCLREDFEKWLQLALDWDGTSRGREPETNNLTIFSSLVTILDKSVVRVFSLPTCEVLSFIAGKDTTVAELQYWVRHQIGLEIDDQILLLTEGRSLNSKANLINSLNKERKSEEVSLYLFSSGPISIQSKPILRPLFVRELLEDPKKMLEYTHLKKSSSDAIFVLQAEVDLYQNIIAALNAKTHNIMERTAAIDTLLEDVEEEWAQVEAFSQFFAASNKTDMEQYVELRKIGGLNSNELVQKWAKKAGELEAKLGELQTSNNIKDHKMQVKTTKEKATDLVNNEFLVRSKSSLDELLTEGLVLYDKVRKIPKDVQGHPMSNTDMVRVLLKMMEASAKLLKSPALIQLFQSIFQAEEAIANLVSPLTLCQRNAKMMRQQFESAQRDRQRSIWALFTEKLHEKKITAPSSPRPEAKEENGNFSPFHIPKTVRAPVSPMDENMLRVDFRVAGPVSLGLHPLSGVRSPNVSGDGMRGMPDKGLFSNDLSYQTDCLTQSCRQMIKDMDSMNWDFLKD